MFDFGFGVDIGVDVVFANRDFLAAAVVAAGVVVVVVVSRSWRKRGRRRPRLVDVWWPGIAEGGES